MMDTCFSFSYGGSEGLNRGEAFDGVGVESVGGVGVNFPFLCFPFFPISLSCLHFCVFSLLFCVEALLVSLFVSFFSGGGEGNLVFFAHLLTVAVDFASFFSHRERRKRNAQKGNCSDPVCAPTPLETFRTRGDLDRIAVIRANRFAARPHAFS